MQLKCFVCDADVYNRDRENNPTPIGGLQGVIVNGDSTGQVDIDLCENHWAATLNAVSKMRKHERRR